MINENQKKMAMKILIHEQLKAMHSTIFILEIFLNNLQTAIPKIASIEYFEITLTMLEIIEEFCGSFCATNAITANQFSFTVDKKNKKSMRKKLWC